MATPVPATPNVNDLRRAIIARLGIDPKKLTAFGGNPKFDADVTNLYRTITKRYGDLDIAAGRLGSDYDFNLANANLDQKRNLRIMENNLGDRGLITSGLAVNQRADLGRTFSNRINALNLARTRGMEDIGRNRNEALNTLLSGRASYEGEYANNLATFLQEQAAAAAAIEAQKPKPTAQVIRPATPAVTRRVSGSSAPRTTPRAAPVIPSSPVRPTPTRPKPRAVSTIHGSGIRTSSGNVMI